VKGYVSVFGGLLQIIKKKQQTDRIHTTECCGQSIVMQVVFFAWNFSGCAPEQLWQFRPCEPCDKAWRSVFTVTIPAEKWDLMNLGLFQDGTSKKKCHFPGKDDDRRCLARSGPLLFCD